MLSSCHERNLGHSAGESEVQDFRRNHVVRFTAASRIGFKSERQTGTVVETYRLPGQGGQTVDVRFKNGHVEKGIRARELEHVSLSRR
jgi:hypothetical protein